MKSGPAVPLLLSAVILAALSLSPMAQAQTEVSPATSAPADTVHAQAAPADTVQAETAPAPAATAPAAAATTPAAPPPATAPPASTPVTPPPATSTQTTQPATAPDAAAQATTPPPAQAQSSAYGGPFARGTNRVSLTAGWGRTFGQDYLLIGGGIGRYLKRGLELGLDFEAWLANDPGIYKLSPEARYVLTRAQRLITPYVGAFYRRTFVDNYDDLNSVGARAGVYKGGGRTHLGFGGVWEQYLDCNESIYSDCSTFYPEASVGVSF